MGSLTNAQDLLILDHHFGGVAIHAPDANLFLRLTTGSLPTKATAATEVSTGAWTNYAPVQVVNNATNFPNATTIANVATKKNGAVISYGTATTTGNVDVTGVEAWTASSGGTRRGWGAVTKTVANGNLVTFPIDSIILTQK